jgi:hypothetical protein
VNEQRDERRAILKIEADKAYKDHVVRSEGDGRWYCGRPTSGTYHFRVVFAPACILVYGDIQAVVLRMPNGDSLGWLRSTVDDLDYVLGKVAAFDGPTKKFSRGDALRKLNELEAQYGEPATRARREYDRHRDRLGDAQSWVEAMNDQGFDTEVPQDWDSQLFWQYHALRHFCRLLDQEPKTQGGNDADHGRESVLSNQG